MKINKREALALAKILPHHVDGGYEESNLSRTLKSLSIRVDGFLVDDEDEDADEGCYDSGSMLGGAPTYRAEEVEDDEEDDEDEEAEDDDEEEEDLEDEDDEEVDEDEEDEDEEGDDGDDEQELSPDSYVEPSRLHALTPARSEGAAVEFEDTDSGTSVDVVVDGYCELTITHLKRKSKELHVRDEDGEWHVYPIRRFPKGWAEVLPLDELCEVEA